jgi:hypothetical protein
VILRDLLQIAAQIGSVLEELEPKFVTMSVGRAFDVTPFTERVQQAERSALVEGNPFGNFTELQFFAILKDFQYVEGFYHRFHYIFVVRFFG